MNNNYKYNAWVYLDGALVYQLETVSMRGIFSRATRLQRRHENKRVTIRVEFTPQIRYAAIIANINR